MATTITKPKVLHYTYHSTKIKTLTTHHITISAARENTTNKRTTIATSADNCWFVSCRNATDRNEKYLSPHTVTANITGLHSHTTHQFNGPFSRTTRVGRYQKGKTNLDFTEARDSEWQWHQLGHRGPMQVYTSLQTDNHTNTSPLSFYGPDALPAAQPTASKHWRHLVCIRHAYFRKSVWYGAIIVMALDSQSWGPGLSLSETNSLLVWDFYKTDITPCLPNTQLCQSIILQKQHNSISLYAHNKSVNTYHLNNKKLH